MKNIIFIAPPAAGKGTVSDYLVSNYGYQHISTGDLLRDEVKKGTEFGKYIDTLISKGNYVPDEDMIKLIEQLDVFNTDNRIILDGFPRTLNQAKVLDDLLIKKGMEDYVVIYLDIDRETAMKRALGRVSCPKCKRTYNINNDKLKPLNANLCDDCQVELIHRSDDNEETFKKRFDTYLENTMPILDYYNNKGVLGKVYASLPLNDIYNNTLDYVISDSNSRIKVKEVNND